LTGGQPFQNGLGIIVIELLAEPSQLGNQPIDRLEHGPPVGPENIRPHSRIPAGDSGRVRKPRAREIDGDSQTARLTRAAATACGRWLTRANNRSCRSGLVTTVRHPSASQNLRIQLTVAGFVREVGVRMQVDN